MGSKGIQCNMRFVILLPAGPVSSSFLRLFKLLRSLCPLPQLVTTIELDCIPTKSMHSVNTERFLQQSRGTNHTDGTYAAFEMCVCVVVGGISCRVC